MMRSNLPWLIPSSLVGSFGVDEEPFCVKERR